MHKAHSDFLIMCIPYNDPAGYVIFLCFYPEEEAQKEYNTSKGLLLVSGGAPWIR